VDYPDGRGVATDLEGDGICTYTVPIQWDRKDARVFSRPCYARVAVRFLYRSALPQGQVPTRGGQKTVGDDAP
jgi:hypothetical protein